MTGNSNARQILNYYTQNTIDTVRIFNNKLRSVSQLISLIGVDFFF